MSHNPGTLFVLRSQGLIPWSIRLLTRSRVNHAGVCLGDGKTVESQAQGAVRLDERPVAGNVLYATELWKQIERKSWGRNATIARQAGMLLGTPYGYPDVLAVIWESWRNGTTDGKYTRLQKRLMREDRLICSQLVDLACLKAGVHLFDDGRPTGAVTPGDLEELFANPDRDVVVD